MNDVDINVLAPAGEMPRCPWCGYDLIAMPPTPIAAHLFLCDRCLNELPATDQPPSRTAKNFSITDASS